MNGRRRCAPNLLVGHLDADGIVATALAWRWMEATHGISDPEVRLLDHPEWKAFAPTLEGSGILGVVDLPGPPCLGEWKDPDRLLFIDHHPTWNHLLAGEAATIEHYASWPWVHLDPEGTSAASMLLDRLRRSGVAIAAPLVEAADLADQADRLDAASPDELYDIAQSDIALAVQLPDLIDPSEACSITTHLHQGEDLRTAVESVVGRDRFRSLRLMTLETLEAAAHAMRVVGGVALLDWRRLPDHRPIRFAAEFHAREAYSVRVEDRGAGALVRVGENPWSETPSGGIDLSELMARYGGGGHTFAAGAWIPQQAVARSIEEILLALSKGCDGVGGSSRGGQPCCPLGPHHHGALDEPAERRADRTESRG